MVCKRHRLFQKYPCFTKGMRIAEDSTLHTLDGKLFVKTQWRANVTVATFRKQLIEILL